MSFLVRFLLSFTLADYQLPSLSYSFNQRQRSTIYLVNLRLNLSCIYLCTILYFVQSERPQIQDYSQHLITFFAAKPEIYNAALSHPRTMNDDDEVPWKSYALHAHTLGLTVNAIRDDFQIHNLAHIGIKEIIRFLVSSNIHPRHSYSWNTYAIRFAIHCRGMNEDKSGIENRLVSRGFDAANPWQIADLPGRITDLLEKMAIMETLMKSSLGESHNPSFAVAIVMAHELGFTILEIDYLLQFLGLQNEPFFGKFEINIKNCLIASGVHKIKHRKGRAWNKIAENYVKAAFNIGLSEDEIWLHTHTYGYDLNLPQIQRCMEKLELETLEEIKKEVENFKEMDQGFTDDEW